MSLCDPYALRDGWGGQDYPKDPGPDRETDLRGNQEQYSVLLVSDLTGRVLSNEKPEKMFFCI